ncbi:LOW QUALITY PROTEIN: Eukaryotic/viral aspartic protease [Phytophthora megakarya]|uniref:Eukaryotic/viral aspartic protease n=1 Tax=Phytophthora megakarya TaxID=4795 RepID=A0A225VYF0_9STRA|nr:LOW QUALITY PROTEIN: Eukaryotic/viral aspartic protease [Phytophthora megakarya]
MNGDTPAANKVLGRTYEELMEKIRGSGSSNRKGLDKHDKLAVEVTATTTGQGAVQFLKSMGLQAQATSTQAVLGSWIPAEAGADIWKWKRKLRVGFGVTDIHYPQPPTTSKGYNTVSKSHGVFSKSGDTLLPRLRHDNTEVLGERPDRDSGRANTTRNTLRGSHEAGIEIGTMGTNPPLMTTMTLIDTSKRRSPE